MPKLGRVPSRNKVDIATTVFHDDKKNRTSLNRTYGSYSRWQLNCMHASWWLYIQCALIESEKIGNLMRILCDPVKALCLIFVCLVPIFDAIYKKN